MVGTVSMLMIQGIRKSAGRFVCAENQAIFFERLGCLLGWGAPVELVLESGVSFSFVLHMLLPMSSVCSMHLMRILQHDVSLILLRLWRWVSHYTNLLSFLRVTRKYVSL